MIDDATETYSSHRRFPVRLVSGAHVLSGSASGTARPMDELARLAFTYVLGWSTGGQQTDRLKGGRAEGLDWSVRYRAESLVWTVPFKLGVTNLVRRSIVGRGVVVQ